MLALLDYSFRLVYCVQIEVQQRLTSYACNNVQILVMCTVFVSGRPI